MASMIHESMIHEWAVHGTWLSIVTETTTISRMVEVKQDLIDYLPAQGNDTFSFSLRSHILYWL